MTPSLSLPFADLPAEQLPTLKEQQLHEALKLSQRHCFGILVSLIFTPHLCWLLLAQLCEVEELLIQFLSIVVGDYRIQIKQPRQWCPEII